MGSALLVRHGETVWNRDGRVQGWAPSALTDRGHEQARALATQLTEEYRVDRLVSSDLRRATETTTHLRRALGLEADYDRGWRERDFGRLQGLTRAELFDGYPEYALDEVGHTAVLARPEGGERLLDTRERVLERWAALRSELGAEETVAVVTHSGPLYVVLGAVEGLGLVRSMTGTSQSNCALNELRVEGGTTEIVRRDDAAHLDAATTADR